MDPTSAGSPDFRPLLQSPVLPGSGAATVLLEEEQLTLSGDQEFVRAVLERCDGTETVAEIADDLGGDATDLIAALAARGALVDCTQAWERFHFESSTASGLFRAIPDADLGAALAQPFAAPTSGDLVALEPAETEIARIAAGRHSARPDEGPRPPSFEELSTILLAAYGRPADGRPPVPSAGGFYPLLLHVVVPVPVGPLAPGLWWFDPEAGALAQVGELSDPAAVFVPYAAHDALLAAGNPVVVVSADVARQARKYSNRAYRFALIEAGAVMQMAYLAGTELGVPIRAIGGVVEERAVDLLQLPAGIAPVLGITVGT